MNNFGIQVADPLGGLNDVVGQDLQRQAQTNKLDAAKALLAEGDPAKIAEFMVANPDLAPHLDAVSKFKNEATKRNAVDTAMAVVTGQKTAEQALVDRIEKVQAEGGDPSETIALLEQVRSNPEVAAKAEEAAWANIARFDPDLYTTLKQEQQAKSVLGKLIEDRNRLAATDPDNPMVARYDQAIEKAATTAGTSADMQGFEQLIEGMSEKEQEQARRVKAGIAPRALTDQIVMIAGVPHKFDRMTETMQPVTVGGEEVTAESVGEDAGIVSASGKAADQAITKSGEMFEQLGKVQQNVNTIDDAIAAIDAGAGTGKWENMMPTVRSSSIELENIANRMGLDVVGATSFGALSAGELALAMSTAMPTDLDEPELRKWLENKKQAQQKLARELSRAAIYLGTPGNTVAEFMQMQQEIASTTEVDRGSLPSGRMVIKYADGTARYADSGELVQ